MAESFLECMSLSDWLFVAVVDIVAFCMAFDYGRQTVLDKLPPSEPPPKT